LECECMTDAVFGIARSDVVISTHYEP
jgi:hypothetical protein